MTSQESESCAEGLIVPAKSAAGVEEQVVEFPVVKGLVLLYRMGTESEAAEHAAIQEEADERGGNSKGKVVKNLCQLVQAVGHSAGVHEHRRPPIVQYDGGMGQGRFKDETLTFFVQIRKIRQNVGRRGKAFSQLTLVRRGSRDKRC